MIVCDITDVHIQEEIKRTFPDEEFLSVENINYCTGCYGCWFKTPGECVIKDGYSTLGERYTRDGKVYIISKCYYGCYSPKVKASYDRMLGLLLPSIKIDKLFQRHKNRYKKKIKLGVIFYGDTTEEERSLAEGMVAMQCRDAGIVQLGVAFGTEDEVIGNVRKLVGKAEGEV